MYEEKNYSTGSLILTFLVGGLVGAGVALLLAPQSGSETRAKIKEMTEDAKEKIKTASEDARLKLADTLSRGKAAATGAVEAGKRAMEEEKQRMMGS